MSRYWRYIYTKSYVSKMNGSRLSIEPFSLFIFDRFYREGA